MCSDRARNGIWAPQTCQEPTGVFNWPCKFVRWTHGPSRGSWDCAQGPDSSLELQCTGAPSTLSLSEGEYMTVAPDWRCMWPAHPSNMASAPQETTRPVVLRALDKDGTPVQPQKVVSVSERRDLYYLYAELGIEDRDAVSCTLLPHARSPACNGSQIDNFSETLASTDASCLQLGLDRCSVISFTVGPRHRSQPTPPDYASTSPACNTKPCCSL